ncbi:probable mitochondrial import inner membrane translocase subunit Tim17 4 [Drosophila pseudoobscura]|uniref:Probable mitochondrial import inner membrane translocase subunit Tim17 4 n=1 Tax=Drosophila pseudoobscura pseudoobscura TaxID=46245 RepID=A0A6I8UQT1_DROPS|nr:probable mitochondrial import inner membrane translocase subunit Tim17 4 [Drosophila pseudoobscura]
MKYFRQPCPIRIVEDAGGAFMMGTIGGSLFQFLKGFRDAPTGIRRGLYGGLDSVKLRTPVIAGSFAVWAATFSTVDCTMIHYRQREDAWNSIVCGAATGGILSARQGIRQMANGALIGCLVLAMIEGASAAVATISAAEHQSIAPGEAQGKQQRPQWDVLQDGSKKDSEFERVLDKCPSFKSCHMGTGPHSLSDLVKMANVV